MLVATENPLPLSPALGDSADKSYCLPFWLEITLFVYILLLLLFLC